MMFPEILTIMVEDLFAECQKSRLTLTVAESCTGGLVAGCITSVPGASQVFDRGFVAYANGAKCDLLAIEPDVIETHGAVSEAVARAMAEGALRAAGTSLGLSITGIAGPDGGSREKPVGLVHIACARHGFETRHQRHVFKGTRDQIRLQGVESSLKLLLNCCAATH